MSPVNRQAAILLRALEHICVEPPEHPSQAAVRERWNTARQISIDAIDLVYAFPLRVVPRVDIDGELVDLEFTPLPSYEEFLNREEALCDALDAAPTLPGTASGLESELRSPRIRPVVGLPTETATATLTLTPLPLTATPTRTPLPRTATPTSTPRPVTSCLDAVAKIFVKIFAAISGIRFDHFELQRLLTDLGRMLGGLIDDLLNAIRQGQFARMRTLLAGLLDALLTPPIRQAFQRALGGAAARRFFSQLAARFIPFIGWGLLLAALSWEFVRQLF
jgi:hypothetical protein